MPLPRVDEMLHDLAQFQRAMLCFLLLGNETVRSMLWKPSAGESLVWDAEARTGQASAPGQRDRGQCAPLGQPPGQLLLTFHFDIRPEPSTSFGPNEVSNP